jgi:predicted transcriptional regulator
MGTRQFKNLGAYLEHTGESQVAFAKRVGVHQSYISRIVAGQFSPGFDLALRIVAATGHAIPVESLSLRHRKGAA